MKNKLKKILLYGSATVLFLVVVLAVHIYLVYRPAPDKNTRVMARIDIKQKIDQGDANKITAWLYHQNGIDHVLVNPQSSIVIFTFYPLKTSGNQIVNKFKESFSYKAERFMPTAENLKNSCPMAASSYTYKIYKLITHII